MPRINISIRDKRAGLCDVPQPRIVCGNSDYVAVFDFDEEWAEYGVKTARFVWSGGYADVVFEGNECAIPLIDDAVQCLIGVYAGDLRTTTPAVIRCRRSILSGSPVHTEPLPDVYNRLIEMIQRFPDDVKAAVEEARQAEAAAGESAEAAATAAEEAKAAESGAKSAVKEAQQAESGARLAVEEAQQAEVSAKAAESGAKQAETGAKSAVDEAVAAVAEARLAESGAKSAVTEAAAAADEAIAAESGAKSAESGAVEAETGAKLAEASAVAAGDEARQAENGAKLAEAGAKSAAEEARQTAEEIAAYKPEVSTEDKAEIANLVLELLPMWDGGSY